MPDEIYMAPPQGWTCFFCGETFTTVGAARDHFGADELKTAGCQIKAGEERGLLMALRRIEAELDRLRSEEHDHQQHYTLLARHGQELRREEEKGYERGLRDGEELERQRRRAWWRDLWRSFWDRESWRGSGQGRP